MQCCGSGSVGSVCFLASWIDSIRQGYGSESGSFCHQPKIVWKILIPIALWLLFDFISLNNDVNVPSKSNKRKNENSRIRIRIRIRQSHGSADPDPHQNVMDPQHWKNINFIGLCQLFWFFLTSKGSWRQVFIYLRPSFVWSRVGKNPGFFKKTQPSGFFLGFLGFLGVFWVFLPRREAF